MELNHVSMSKDDVVKVEGKIGIDGSGSHQIRHQLVKKARINSGDIIYTDPERNKSWPNPELLNFY